MKARHEFLSDKEYKDYLIVYFTGCQLTAIAYREGYQPHQATVGDCMKVAEIAVKVVMSKITNNEG